jgi:hypothetical protein
MQKENLEMLSSFITVPDLLGLLEKDISEWGEELGGIAVFGVCGLSLVK